MITETDFPVSGGTEVPVSCEDGVTNTGSATVICNTYLPDDYTYTDIPRCGEEEEIDEIIPGLWGSKHPISSHHTTREVSNI